MKLTLLLLPLPLFALSAPEPASPVILDSRNAKPAGPGEVYNVIIKGKDDPRSVDDLLKDFSLQRRDARRIYNNPAFKGFSAILSGDCVDKTERKKYLVFGRSVSLEWAGTARGPWGLKRISQVDRVAVGNIPLDSNKFEHYVFDGEAADLGRGVDIYILDSGVDTAHPQFGGRAEWGYTWDSEKIDDIGHGTMTAGIAGSNDYGVARGANIIAVRVGGRMFEPDTESVVAGIDWMIEHHTKRQKVAGFRGSVATIALSRRVSGPADLDTIVELASKSGIHLAVSAGNAGIDACEVSPARLSERTDINIVTVGALNADDSRRPRSNYGKCVTLYAPGESVLTTTPGDPPLGHGSGTSVAGPHVAGIMAVFLGQHPEHKLNTAQVKVEIVCWANLITLNHDPALKPGTKVLVAYNGNNL